MADPPSSAAGYFTTLDGRTVEIRDVWASNLEEEMDNIMRETTEMAHQPLRVIAFAYSVVDIEDWRQNFEDNGRQFEQAFDEN